jgi:hypothetical protein
MPRIAFPGPTLEPDRTSKAIRKDYGASQGNSLGLIATTIKSLTCPQLGAFFDPECIDNPPKYRQTIDKEPPT